MNSTAETYESKILAIMKTFFPSDGVRFGESVYRVADGVYTVSIKPSFSIKELVRYVNVDSVWRDRPLKIADITNIFSKMVESGLITKLAIGEYYSISDISKTILVEFFTLNWAPRVGRTGFRNFLLQSKLRTVQWCCICLGIGEFGKGQVSRLSGLNVDACRTFLERLTSNGQLRRAGHDRYRLSKESKIMKELASGYKRYQFPRPNIRDHMIEIMKEHDKISGKDLYKHLQVLGYTCSDKIVYHHLRELKREKKIIEVERIERKAIPERYLSWIEEDEDSSKRELLGYIQKIFGRVGIVVGKEFLVNALKNKAYVLRVFHRQLWCTTLAEDKHDYSSCHMWTDMLNHLDEKGFPEIVSKFLSTNSRSEQEKEIQEILKTYEISPALLSMLRFFQDKKVKFGNNE
jgi:hypothetical protein